MEYYPHVCLPRRALASEVKKGLDGQMFEVAGRITARRDHGGIVFMDLKDGSGEIQLASKSKDDSYADLTSHAIGDIAQAYGQRFTTPSGEPTIRVAWTKLCAKAKKAPHQHVLEETRLRRRELDPDLPTTLTDRAKIVRALRQWLDCRGYTEIETPTLQTLAGGSSSEPFRTRCHALHQDLELSKSPELYMNRVQVGGMEKVYSLSKQFRNEGISRRHQPEFTELEWFTPYIDYKLLMLETESLIMHTAYSSLGRTTFECQGQTIDLLKPWRRVAFHDLVKQETGEVCSLAECIMATYSEDVEKTLIQPTFVCDWPVESFPITKRHRENPNLCEHFDAVIGGWEIVSGDTELNDPEEQRERFVRQRESQMNTNTIAPFDEEYCQALEYGLPPCAGGGMGVDRLVAILTEAESVRKVTPFPLMREAESKLEKAA